MSNTYNIDYLLKEEEYLYQGYGKKMIGLLEEKIREESDALKIIVQLGKENVISRKTLFACGYKKNEEYDFFCKILK